MRQNISSGYPFEEIYGYSRAVRAGAHVFVSGTTARAPDLDRDAYGQMTAALKLVSAALSETGADLTHVVRTVVYVRDMNDVPLVARAHAESFGSVRPASTIVEVSALTPPEALVEVEVTAVLSGTEA